MLFTVPSTPDFVENHTLLCKMELLDINFTKKSRIFCSMLLVSQSLLVADSYSSLVLKYHAEKSAKQENPSLLMNSIF